MPAALLLVPCWAWRWAAIAALACALLSFGWIKGAAHVQNQWDAASGTQALQVAVTRQRQAEATVQVVTQYVDRVRTVHAAGEAIIKEVPVYVTKESDAHCPVPAGFVGLWNGANRGELPSPTGDSDAATSTVVLSDIATQHGIEARQCRETEEQLIGLQEWIKSMSGLN